VVFAVAAMSLGGLLVHFGQGPVQIEMHFYFFVLLALLAVTANPTAIIAAAATIALHHGLLFFFLPKSVFNYEAELWVVGVHTIFVVIESVAACFVARSFFDNVVGLEAIVARRTLQLDARNRDLRTVFDHVGEGLVTMDLDGRMGPERSAAFQAFFGPEGGASQAVTLAEAVRPFDESFAIWVELGLSELRSGAMPAEVVIDQLPRRVVAQRRTLDVSYQPIIGSDSALEQLLVVFEDVTARVLAARAEAEHRETMSALEHFSRDRQGFLDFLDEASGLAKRLGAPDGDAAVVARMVHTLKGNAAMFGFHSIALACHEVETRAQESHAISPADGQSLARAWSELETRLGPLLGDAVRNVVHVQRREYDDVMARIRSTGAAPEFLQVLDTLESWGFDAVEARLARLTAHARSLAARLGKPGLSTTSSAGGLALPREAWASFWSAMVHVVRNAVDHGIESPEERAAAGKSPGGHIDVSAGLEGGEFVVRVKDDGAGIDWKRVGEQAARRGLPHGSREELTRALFADGLSTREALNLTSGRGVGLSAVEAEVERRHGRIFVDSAQGQGSTWELRFPESEIRRVPPGRSESASRRQAGAAA
jgi:two-component system chemotaxis sensor kinase CheA